MRTILLSTLSILALIFVSVTVAKNEEAPSKTNSDATAASGRPQSEAKEKPRAKGKAKAKAKAKNRRKRIVPEKEPEMPLAGDIVRIAREGLQIDLPAAAVTASGAVLIAAVEWDGETDALRLHRIGDSGGSDTVATLLESAVLHEPALAIDGEGTAWCFFGATHEDDETVDLLVRSWNHETGLGDLEVLSDSTAAEAFVDAGVDSEGRVWVTWQSFRAGEGDIFARWLDPEAGSWSETIAVSDRKGGDWEPEIAFDESGKAWVLYDSSRGNEFDLYLARVDPEGTVEEFPVGHSDRYEARGSIVATADGEGFWIAAERGKRRWGLDSRGHRNETGINAGKTVLFGRFDIGTATFNEIPPGPAGLAGGNGPINVPVVGVGSDGAPWLAYRYFQSALWRIALTAYRVEDDSWSSRRRLPESSYGQDRRSVLLPGADGGDIRILWPSDGRVHKAHGEVALHLAKLGSPAGLPAARPPAAGKEEEAVAHAPSQDTPERPADDRHRWENEGRSYRLYWGDLHRHTDVSNCRTGFDGSIVDHFRYAYDLAKLDFLGTSDHTDIGKIYHPYEWWHNQRMHDALHSPGRFNTLYVYEREQRWPWGHRNIVFARRGGPIVYIKRQTYRESPWQETFPVETGVGEISPYELWDLLEDYGKPVASISHTGATGMGTDWGKYERIGHGSENVVEIYQGARVSYEGEGAPQPTAGLEPGEGYTVNGDAEATPPAAIVDFGKFRAGTYQNALELGRKLGVFASSDHISQHVSYGGVYCEEFTREAIIEAFDNRRTIAATDRIHLDFSCNDRPLGSIFETDEDPRIRLRIDGTAPLERVTIVRNEENWKVFDSIDGAGFEREVVDEEPLAGENRYYIRVEQVDGNMAWSSPVWVTRK